jgi:hypothetical protein
MADDPGAEIITTSTAKSKEPVYKWNKQSEQLLVFYLLDAKKEGKMSNSGFQMGVYEGHFWSDFDAVCVYATGEDR